MHVPFDYNTAPLPIAKYNPIMEFGKVIKYVWGKSQKKEYKIHFCFPVLQHLTRPFFQHGFLLPERYQAAEQGMPRRHQDHAGHSTRSEREGVNCNGSYSAWDTLLLNADMQNKTAENCFVGAFTAR